MTLAPLSRQSLHAVIDMQRLFADPGDWHVPGLTDIMPNVEILCRTTGPNTVYARFLTPPRAELAPGRWKALYQRWPNVTSEALPHDAFDLVEPLPRLSAQGMVVDKTTYSLLAAPGFPDQFRKRGTDTMVFSGVETDVCVYASLIAAVDLGMRVVLAIDAVASSDQATHFSTLDLLARRLPEQVELATTAEIVAAWPS